MNYPKQITKEWYRCKSFEKVLSILWEENPDIKFKRRELLDKINRGHFGANLVATNSPEKGTVEEKLSEYRKVGQEWLDIQNLTYHYSHHNPMGNFHSQIQMLVHLGGSGDNSVYSLYPEAFERN
jgi:hypothetical protein